MEERKEGRLLWCCNCYFFSLLSFCELGGDFRERNRGKARERDRERGKDGGSPTVELVPSSTATRMTAPQSYTSPQLSPSLPFIFFFLLLAVYLGIASPAGERSRFVPLCLLFLKNSLWMFFFFLFIGIIITTQSI